MGRHSATNRAILVLSDLMRGKVLDRRTIAARTSSAPVTADRTIASLLACPGVETARDGNRLTVRFDPAKVGGAVSITTAVAAALASSLAPLFHGSTYEAGIRSATRGIVERTKRRRQFQDLERKFYFLVRGGEVGLQGDGARLDEVIDGILRCERVQATYRRFDGRPEKLLLDPLSLVVHEHQLYVVARGAGRSAYAYRFSRFEAIERTGATFEYPRAGVYDPSTLFVDRFGIFLSDDHEVQEVKIRLDPRWRTYAETNRWHRSQRISIDDDGVTVMMTVRACPELVSWILGFGEEAEVLAPPGLRRRVAERLTAAAERYRPRGQLPLFAAEPTASRPKPPQRAQRRREVAKPDHVENASGKRTAGRAKKRRA